MPTPRIFVVRVIRRTGPTEVLGVVEHASSRKRVAFRTADALWRAVAGPVARSRRVTQGGDAHAASADSPSDTGHPRQPAGNSQMFHPETSAPIGEASDEREPRNAPT